MNLQKEGAKMIYCFGKNTHERETKNSRSLALGEEGPKEQSSESVTATVIIWCLKMFPATDDLLTWSQEERLMLLG